MGCLTQLDIFDTMSYAVRHHSATDSVLICSNYWIKPDKMRSNFHNVSCFFRTVPPPSPEETLRLFN